MAFSGNPMTTPAATAYLGLGSNIGTEAAKLVALRGAIAELEKHPGIKVTGKSSVYRSSAWGYTQQDDFLNAVIRIETSLAPLELLRVVKDAETAVGRYPTFRWGPRVIDVDILLLGDLDLKSDALTIPHKFLLERDFAYVPLLELEPDVCLPTGKRVAEAVPASSQSGESLTKAADLVLGDSRLPPEEGGGGGRGG
ncbi:MAG: 2-amino-4-hydroxy-6-hydroxymethyldihydropteridine diphosphokinase [Candidatus Sumerlaeaceae bacterium]|nr:2-amino-4-hydroxy-6-hydroxymethyldihydropteridine diphosphokinase [Candidatus Sumerlaeaceae bacterium]